MTCECPECTEYDGPNPVTMRVRLLVLSAQFLVALVGLWRERSFKALGVFLGAIAFFFTIPRYLICARCEGYGKDCYSLYMGKVTSMIWPKVEGKEVSPLGALLEVLTLLTVTNAPVVGLRSNRKLLALYMLLANATFWMHFSHACRHCAQYATDWKKDCPAAKAARGMFSGRQVQF